jgi:hypothetical protein
MLLTTLIVVLGVGALVALIAAPMLLAWPNHVRWLLAVSTMPDPAGMWLLPSAMYMREGRLVAFERDGDRVQVWLEFPGAAGAAAATQFRVAASPGVIDALGTWRADGTPLLCLTHANDELSLHGPEATISEVQSTPHALPWAA